MNFFLAGERMEIWKIIGGFCIKKLSAWAKSWHRSFLSWPWKAIEISDKNWIVVCDSVKIYGEFEPGLTLFLPAALHSLSLHNFWSYPFQCKTSKSLSGPALSSPALYAILMLLVSCFNVVLPFCTYLILNVLHSWNIGTYNRKKT